MNPGDYVKFKEPEWTDVINQGERPKGLSYNINGEKMFIAWGDALKIKESCPNGIFQAAKSGNYNYLDARYVERNKDLFTIIPRERDKKKQTKKGDK